jgi:co-chaperonin GroES (HSP10)
MIENIAVPKQGLILPQGVKTAPAPVQPTVDEEYENAIQKAKAMPSPSGFKILCALVESGNTYESGLLKADETKKVEELTSPVLFVIKLGPDAYKDEEKFPSGPWCAEGDFVITRAYTGTRMKIHGKEFRIIYDDQVEGVVEDPRGISRA